MSVRVARMPLPLAFALGLLAGSRLALAADGVVEINQQKALAGGVGPGDEPGFPVTLSEPGKYRLTADLSVPRDANGIEIAADGLTLDLGGFTLSGGEPPLISGAGRSRVTVQNGVLRSPGCCGGIKLGPQARLWAVDVERPTDAASLGPWSLVTDSHLDGGDGIGLVMTEGVVRASTIEGLSVLHARYSLVVDSSSLKDFLVGRATLDGTVARRTRFSGFGSAEQAREATVLEEVVVDHSGCGQPALRLARVPASRAA
jgi:hypothetical protein